MSLLLRQQSRTALPEAAGSSSSGIPNLPPRSMLCKRPCEVMAQVAAHWSDLDEELLVSAGTKVPRESLLGGAQTVLLPKGGRSVKLAGSCSSPSDSTALAMLFHLSSAFTASCF